MIPILVIWRGWGIVVLGIVIAAIVAGYVLGSQLNLDDTSANVVIALSLIPAGVVTWFVGKRMNRGRDDRFIEFTTGQETVIRRPGHEFFFVSVERWGVILIGIGPVWATYLALRPPTG